MATQLSKVKGFVTSQRNAGATGLKLVAECVDHMFVHGDWTPLAWLISRTEKRDAATLRAIAGKVMGGVRLIKDDKQESGIRILIADNAGPTEEMATLRQLIEDGASFRSKSVADELLSKQPAEWELAAYAKRVMKTLESKGVTLADMLAAV